jgi:hypothetical protein
MNLPSFWSWCWAFGDKKKNPKKLSEGALKHDLPAHLSIGTSRRAVVPGRPDHPNHRPRVPPRAFPSSLVGFPLVGVVGPTPSGTFPVTLQGTIDEGFLTSGKATGAGFTNGSGGMC